MNLATFVRIAAVTVALGGLAACGSAPIYEVTNHNMPPAAERLTQEEIDSLVIQEAHERGWRLEQIGPGHIKAILESGHQRESGPQRAVAEIRANKQNLNIKYLESTNLNERNGKIDRSYNRWIRILQRDIVEAVAAVGAVKGTNR
jgi:hypothetical protein